MTNPKEIRLLIATAQKNTAERYYARLYSADLSSAAILCLFQLHRLVSKRRLWTAAAAKKRLFSFSAQSGRAYRQQ